MRRAKLPTSWFFLANCLVFVPSAEAQPSAPGITDEAVRRVESSRFDVWQGFIENRGQWDADILYSARIGGIDATFTRDSIVFRPTPSVAGEGPRWRAPVVMRVPSASRVEPSGDLISGHLHFLLGADRSRWATHVRSFESITYFEVARGVDLVVRQDRHAGGFAYDLHAVPGAALDELELEIDGVLGTSPSDGKLLELETAGGVLRQQIGRVWQFDTAKESDESQDIEGTRFEIVRSGDDRVAFRFTVPGYDPSRSLVIDPSIVWSTYVGGTSGEIFGDEAIGAGGEMFLSGYVGSFPLTTAGAYDTTNNGLADAWVAKLSADGSSLHWATLLGGNMSEFVFGLEVLPDGSAVVGGQTWSLNFPTTPGALQPVKVGDNTINDLFVTKLTPDGSALVWSTYYGGPDYEVQPAFAACPDGEIVAAATPENGVGSLGSLPATPGAFDPIYDKGDAFLARISADGSTLRFHTYFSVDRILDMKVDLKSNVVFVGDIYPGNPLPATPGAFQESWGMEDVSGYVARLSGDGKTLRWATYLDGIDSLDTIWGVALDAANAVYVCGQTGSSDFPTTSGAYSVTYLDSGYHGFVSKLLPNGSDLVWSTYIGTTCCGGGGYKKDVAIGPAGDVVAVGTSNEPQYPTTPDALQPNYVGPFPFGDGHIARFDVFGEKLLYSSWFSGHGSDRMHGVEIAPDRLPVIVAETSSQNLPATAGAFDPTYNGNLDLVVAKFDLPVLPWTLLPGGSHASTHQPILVGSGTLASGTPTRISMRGAPPNASGLLFAGLGAIDVPLAGAVFVPSPDILVPISVGSPGNLELGFPWPSGVPSGITLSLQVWLSDPTAFGGAVATNGLRLTTP